MCYWKRWLKQESPGLKPDWLAEINPLLRKKPNISLYKSLSEFYCKLEVKTLDNNFLRFVYVFFVCFGTTLAFFHSYGYIPLSLQLLKISLNGLQMVCEYWSHHDHAPYLDLALQLF